MNINTFISIGKRAIIASLLFMASGVDYVFASKGEGDKRSEKGVVLLVSGFEVKKVYMTPRSLMSIGATYKGTIFPSQPTSSSTQKSSNSSIVTFERGNTIFIVPVKTPKVMQKFIAPSRNNFKF